MLRFIVNYNVIEKSIYYIRENVAVLIQQLKALKFEKKVAILK